MTISTACGIAVGYCADRVWGDPRRGHPVAVFGYAAGALEERMWADSRGRGAAFTFVAVGGGACAGVLAQRLARRPWQRAALTAVVTWAALGGRSLEKEGEEMAARLAQALSCGDLTPARERLSHLCSRDAATLDVDALARATVESLAENTADAVTGAVFWGALCGVPGLIAYRAANTLDSMVGYRTPRHTNFGWAAARLDDVLNLAPARLTAAATVLVAPVLAKDRAAASRARQAWRRDAAAHPSPNAGPVEASAAGALGVRLGGTNSYAGEAEARGVLGDGRRPTPADVPRAVELARVVGGVCTAVCVALACVVPPLEPVRPRSRRP